MKSESPHTRYSLATRLLRVVFGFYLVVVIGSTIGQMVVEYRYQTNSIRKEFLNIQTSFEPFLAEAIWALDVESVRASAKGIIGLPVIVGMKIHDESGKTIAVGGVVQNASGAGETGLQVNLSGFDPDAAQALDGKAYGLAMFEGTFPITRSVNGEPRGLGRVTLYSNASVVWDRVKVAFLMLGVNAIVEIGLLWLIFSLVFVRLLKKPLAELTTAVDRVTLDNLDSIRVSVPPGCRDELGVLATSFNQMLFDLRNEIAKRKIADVSLAASEAKLHSILRVAPAGIGLIKGRVFDSLNPAMSELTGYGPEELLGQSTQLLYPKDDESIRAEERLHTLIVQHGLGMIEVVWRRKDGRCVDVLLSAAPLIPNNPNGDMTFIAMDITERKRAEEALRESEDKFRKSFEFTPIPIAVANNKGDMVFLNKCFIETYGYTLDDSPTIGDWFNLAYPDIEYRNIVLNDWGKKVADALKNNVATIPAEYLATCRNGEVKTVEISAYFDRDFSIGLFQDITGRKQAQAEREKLQSQLTQAQKMESVGRLAGGVAHDFNNMLQAILGNAALALQDLPPVSPLREYLEEIEKSGNRSADLTRQLLAFARKQTIAPKVLDLNDTVAGMLKMLRRLIGEDIELAWIPGASLWPVKMDPSQIDQVLANLCVNARDAIEGVGTVRIETTNVTLDDTYVATHPEVVAGDYVLIAVSDTGKGMDAETRSHLFEPFFTTKEQGKGTGLGLATVFGIVKQNLGLISVYSEPGQGTTFKIYLPRAAAQTQIAVTTALKRDRRGKETVLLVEDEEQVLALARRILQRQGYTVLAAATPEAALELANREVRRIQLLITDVVMPGMNGRELYDRLKAIQPELRCLYMSGYTADVIAHRGVLDGGVRFLQKPFTIESLAEGVREVLEIHRETPRQL